MERQMAERVRIDFVSDVVCPWCVIGLRALQEALDRLGGEVAADIRVQPFELNPGMAREGENVTEHVRKKYGSSSERSSAARQAIAARGAELGFAFNYGPDSRIWNTFDAHRLLHWAGLEGKQLALKDALFKANFTDQRDVSDPVVLASVADDVGLDGARALQILSTDEFADVVREEENLWRSRGIQAVPSVVVNGRWLIQGGQPSEVFEEALRKIVRESAPVS
jgi:predicted DsbA family dithiol-disulfide isomerase